MWALLCGLAPQLSRLPVPAHPTSPPQRREEEASWLPFTGASRSPCSQLPAHFSVSGWLPLPLLRKDRSQPDPELLSLTPGPRDEAACLQGVSGGEGSSGVWPPGRGCLFPGGWPRFGDGFMVPSGRCAWAGLADTGPGQGRGHQVTVGSCPPAVAWPLEEAGTQVGMSHRSLTKTL